MIKHLWFDMAGTLYRETRAFNAEHDELRYTTYAKLVGEANEQKAKEAYDKLYAQHGSNSAVFRSLGQPSDYWQKVFEHLTDSLRPDPVVTETLATLGKIVPLSLFTNFKRAKILTLLKQLTIPAADFTHILSGDDVSERKPGLEGFHKMVELSGVPANQIMYVGDRVDVDVKPAKQVGMQTCLIYGESSEADYSVQIFGKVENIVKQNI